MDDKNRRSDEAEIPDRNGEDAAAVSGAALKPAISLDPVLGIPVLGFGDDAPLSTSEWVEEMLSDFP